jgi:diketogulonate reductase-like aldo/keto reductase
MTMTINSRLRLNNGVEIPYLGLGVYLASAGKEIQQAVHHALQVGYRLFDTASMYENEYDVGKVIRESPIPREEIFVTTKLWNSDHGYDKSIKAFHKSLNTLSLKYIDLYLIHWPVEELRRESWRALETLLETEKCRAIGVSNYMIHHLEELFGYAKVLPAVNQVEFTPFLYLKELLDFCRSHQIQLESYSPLTRGKKFNHPLLQELSRKYQKTPAQILIRWNLQQEVVVIPKSSRPERIEENAAVFDFTISLEDMELLNQLDQNYRVSWNPSQMP